MRKALSPLRNRPFRRLVGVDAFSQLGDWSGQIALAILVFDKTQSPLAVALLFFCMKAIPAIASPPLVARLEALPLRLSLPFIYGIEAIAFLALAGLVKSFFFPAVLALALLDGALWLSSITMIQSNTALLLGRGEELRRGNALLNVAFTSAFAIGPAIGGVAVATLGLQAALLIDAGTFLVGAVVIMNTHGLPEGHPAASEWLAHLKQGFQFLRSQIALRRVILANTAMVLFATVPLPIEVFFVRDTLGAGNAGLGFFMASWGAGAALGGLIFLIYSRAPLYLLTLLGVLAVAATYVGTAFAPNLLIASVLQLVGGVGNGVAYVSVITIVQLITPDSFQYRVVSVHNALASSLIRGFGYMMGGALGALTSTRLTFGFAGVGVFLVVLAALPLLIPYSRLEAASAAQPESAGIP